ncbi:MAG: HEAT repeat domain-containing protein [Cyanobacteria bacterium P01_C01_bin.69]
MDQPTDPNSSNRDAYPPLPADDSFSPASAQAQAKVDLLIKQVNEQIELLAFDDPNPALLRQMIQSLVDPRRAARISLVDSLSQIGEPATPFLLEGLSGHPEPVVRRACCNALTNIGDETSVAGLVKALLEDADISVKSAAAGALAKVGAPAFDSICGVLASPEVSESCKGHAAWAMATMSSEVSEKLYRVMNDPSPAVRTAVVGAIAQLAQKQLAAQAQAKTAAAQPTPPQQNTDQAQPPPTKPTKPAKTKPNEQANNTLSLLTEALSDPAADVRIEAAAHLARLNCQKAYQPLVACLKDPDWEVRKAAALALGKLGNVEAIDAIAALKADTETAVQRVATLVLEQLEAQANP